MTKLLEAARILREGGWITGEYEDDRGAHCLVGAVSAAYGCDGGWAETGAGEDIAAIETAIGLLFPDHASEMIVDFNDDTETTEADVLLVLEKAAAEAGELP